MVIETASSPGPFRNTQMSKAAQTHKLRKLRAPSKCRECDSLVVFHGAECEEVTLDSFLLLFVLFLSVCGPQHSEYYKFMIKIARGSQQLLYHSWPAKKSSRNKREKPPLPSSACLDEEIKGKVETGRKLSSVTKFTNWSQLGEWALETEDLLFVF